MKLLFTADLHIKVGQKDVPIDWAKRRYYLLFEEIYKLQDSCDLLVVGGDIFDKNPNMEELELYWDFISKLSVRTIIYSGNHEAIKKDTTFFTFLKRATNKLNSSVTIVDDYYSIDNIDFIPYNRLKDKEWPEHLHGNILCTHVRGEIPPHVKPEINLDKLNRWDLVLAGDLHSYENSQRNILYPGSPITTSFHRNLVSTGVIILDTETLEHTWIKLDLPQLLKKSIGVGETPVATDFHHTVYEIEGSLADLSTVEDSSLISKKITKRSVDTALVLDPTMTMVEEIREYLLYILMIDDEKYINEIIEKAVTDYGIK